MEKLTVPYSKVVLSDGQPNEAYLAELRTSLKTMEAAGGQVFLVPEADGSAYKDTDSALALTAAYKHCARRVKDCAAVIGFAIPSGFAQMDRGEELIQNFKDELLEKHPHYQFC